MAVMAVWALQTQSMAHLLTTLAAEVVAQEAAFLVVQAAMAAVVMAVLTELPMAHRVQQILVVVLAVIGMRQLLQATAAQA
jgi:hypothetical protein